jgi:hypothetical protein
MISIACLLGRFAFNATVLLQDLFDQAKHNDVLSMLPDSECSIPNLCIMDCAGRHVEEGRDCRHGKLLVGLVERLTSHMR